MTAVHTLISDLSAYGARPAKTQEIDWSSAVGQVQINGAPVNYAELGDPANPAMVLIHGLSGSWLNWKLVMPLLAEDHHVVALDLPGFGKSPLPEAEISMDGYAALIDQLCDQLGLGRVAVAANSMGGYVAIELAANHPDRVSSLTLSSPAGIATGGMNTQRMITNAKRLAAVMRLAPTPMQRALMHSARWRKRTLGQIVRYPERLGANTAAETISGAGSAGYIPAVCALAQRNIHAQAQRVSCPALIVWGDRDRIISVKHAQQFAAILPVTEIQIFQDTGHLQMVEYPARFAELVDRFVKSESKAIG